MTGDWEFAWLGDYVSEAGDIYAFKDYRPVSYDLDG